MTKARFRRRTSYSLRGKRYKGEGRSDVRATRCAFRARPIFPSRFPFLAPATQAILHLSRNEFSELSSYEVRRLNQFETADIIRIGLAVLHAWLSR